MEWWNLIATGPEDASSRSRRRNKVEAGFDPLESRLALSASTVAAALPAAPMATVVPYAANGIASPVTHAGMVSAEQVGTAALIPLPGAGQVHAENFFSSSSSFSSSSFNLSD